MYTVTTNFGTYTLKLIPSLEDRLKYYHCAHSRGIAIPAIKFDVVETPEPRYDSISTILSDVTNGKHI